MYDYNKHSFFFLYQEIDHHSGKRQLCGGSQGAIEKMLVFGRELQAMHNQLKAQYGHNEPNKKMLQVCVCCIFKHFFHQSCNKF